MSIVAAFDKTLFCNEASKYCVLRLKTAGPATPPLAAKPSQAAETPGPSPAPAEPVATEEMEQLPEDTEHSAPAEAAEAPSQPEEEQKEEISDGGGNH